LTNADSSPFPFHEWIETLLHPTIVARTARVYVRPNTSSVFHSKIATPFVPVPARGPSALHTICVAQPSLTSFPLADRPPLLLLRLCHFPLPHPPDPMLNFCKRANS